MQDDDTDLSAGKRMHQHLRDEAARGTAARKAEFGRRLYRMVQRLGMTQAEFARHCGIGRDNIPRYIKGISLPGDHHLEAMARALNVSADELRGEFGKAPALVATIPATIEFRDSLQHPEAGWLRVERLVSRSAAIKILQILDEDKVPGAPAAERA